MLKSLDYTESQVLHIAQLAPFILTYSVENLEEKIQLYNFLKMHELAYINPMTLMTSSALIYARYMFLKSKGIVVNMNNYNVLFRRKMAFKSQYGIEEDELLKLYNYDDYKRSKIGNVK